jgi:hypothetical protein
MEDQIGNATSLLGIPTPFIVLPGATVTFEPASG